MEVFRRNKATLERLLRGEEVSRRGLLGVAATTATGLAVTRFDNLILPAEASNKPTTMYESSTYESFRGEYRGLTELSVRVSSERYRPGIEHVHYKLSGLTDTGSIIQLGLMGNQSRLQVVHRIIEPGSGGQYIYQAFKGSARIGDTVEISIRFESQNAVIQANNVTINSSISQNLGPIGTSFVGDSGIGALKGGFISLVVQEYHSKSFAEIAPVIFNFIKMPTPASYKPIITTHGLRWKLTENGKYTLDPHPLYDHSIDGENLTQDTTISLSQGGRILAIATIDSFKVLGEWNETEARQ